MMDVSLLSFFGLVLMLGGRFLVSLRDGVLWLSFTFRCNLGGSGRNYVVSWLKELLPNNILGEHGEVLLSAI